MKHSYTPRNTCTTRITFELDGDIVRDIRFVGGCHGNLQAVARLLEGATVDRVEETCAGILCGRRPTSCADQLATAVRRAYARDSRGREQQADDRITGDHITSSPSSPDHPAADNAAQAPAADHPAADHPAQAPAAPSVPPEAADHPTAEPTPADHAADPAALLDHPEGSADALV